MTQKPKFTSLLVAVLCLLLYVPACTPPPTSQPPPTTAAPTATFTHIPPTPTPTATPLPDSRLTVTFTGNCGFILEAAGKKVMVDGISTLTEGVVSRVFQNGEPPFDDIDLILVTHTHSDHFSPSSLGSYLAQHEETLLVSTPRAAEILAFSHAGFEHYADRVISAEPQPGERVAVDFTSISIEALFLDHDWPVFNLGDWTVFHPGDGLVLDDFIGYDLASDQIDVAFVTLPFLIEMTFGSSEVGDYGEIVTVVGADVYIPMHIDPNDSNTEGYLAEIAERYPNMILMTEPLESVVFE